MARKDTQGKVVRHVLHRGKIIPYSKLPAEALELAPVATKGDDDDKAEPVDTGNGDNTDAFSVGTVATRQPGEPANVQPAPAAPVAEQVAPVTEPVVDAAAPPATPPVAETGAPAPGNEAAARADGEQDATPPAEAPAPSPVTEQVAAEQPVTTPAVEAPTPTPTPAPAPARRGRGRPPRNS